MFYTVFSFDEILIQFETNFNVDIVKCQSIVSSSNKAILGNKHTINTLGYK